MRITFCPLAAAATAAPNIAAGGSIVELQLFNVEARVNNGAGRTKTLSVLADTGCAFTALVGAKTARQLQLDVDGSITVEGRGVGGGSRIQTLGMANLQFLAPSKNGRELVPTTVKVHVVPDSLFKLGQHQMLLNPLAICGNVCILARRENGTCAIQWDDTRERVACQLLGQLTGGNANVETRFNIDDTGNARVRAVPALFVANTRNDLFDVVPSSPPSWPHSRDGVPLDF